MKKGMTIDDLAVMVAKGFEGTDKRFESVATKTDIARLEKSVVSLEQRIVALDNRVAALESKLTNYLELSDKRYLELKRRDLVMAKWLKQIADKTGVQIDLGELEKPSHS